MKFSESRVANFHVDDHLNPYLPHIPIERLPTPISRWLGYRKEVQPEPPVIFVWLWSFVGAFTGIIVIEAILLYAPGLQKYNPPFVIASLGASAILDYNAIGTPLAQPRNAVFGQTFSAIIGVGITKLFQLNSDFDNLQWVAGALSTATASFVMSFTNTVHPPGGATALLAATNIEIVALGWMFVPFVLMGSVVMLTVALLVNNIQRRYPLYWWTAADLRKTKEVDLEKVPTNSSEQTLRASTSMPFPPHDIHSIVIGPKHIFLPDHVDLHPDEYQVLADLQSRMREDRAYDERPSAD